LLSREINVGVLNQHITFPSKEKYIIKNTYTHHAFLYKMELLVVEMLCISITFTHSSTSKKGAMLVR